jgi:phosphohistidine phosphatase
MKKIIFVRHARAEEDTGAFPDFERSLTANGKSTSEKMAVKFREKEKEPMLLITSPAFRAYETALVFARVLKYKPENVILKNAIYTDPNLNALGGILSEVDDETDTVVLFGHNPSFTELADRLSKNGCDFIPKAGIVCISFRAGTWKGIVRERGTLEYFLKPDKT